jgi:hypothetical protein
MSQKFEEKPSSYEIHENALAERWKSEGKQRVHFCPEWDYLPIHEESVEFEACLCGLNDAPCNTSP